MWCGWESIGPISLVDIPANPGRKGRVMGRAEDGRGGARHCHCKENKERRGRGGDSAWVCLATDTSLMPWQSSLTFRICSQRTAALCFCKKSPKSTVCFFFYPCHIRNICLCKLLRPAVCVISGTSNRGDIVVLLTHWAELLRKVNEQSKWKFL